MPELELHEGEEVEFKRQWTDQAMEDLAAFANTRGGALFVGRKQQAEAVRLDAPIWKDLKELAYGER